MENCVNGESFSPSFSSVSGLSGLFREYAHHTQTGSCWDKGAYAGETTKTYMGTRKGGIYWTGRPLFLSYIARA